MKWDEDGHYEALDFKLMSSGGQEPQGQCRFTIKDVDVICCKKLGISDGDDWNNFKRMGDLTFRMADTFPDQISVFIELRILDEK